MNFFHKNRNFNNKKWQVDEIMYKLLDKKFNGKQSQSEMFSAQNNL